MRIRDERVAFISRLSAQGHIGSPDGTRPASGIRTTFAPWMVRGFWGDRGRHSGWRCRPRSTATRGPREQCAGPEEVQRWWRCGMRGTVTRLLRSPNWDFPFRDLILTTAFGVTLGTLVLQGLTLRPLLLRLGIKDDGAVEREARLARVESLRAAVDAVAAGHGDESAELVRRRFALQLQRAEKEFAADGANENRLTPEGATPQSSPAAEANSGDDVTRPSSRCDRSPAPPSGAVARRRHDRRRRVPTSRGGARLGGARVVADSHDGKSRRRAVGYFDIDPRLTNRSAPSPLVSDRFRQD